MFNQNNLPRTFTARDLCVILGMSLNNVYALMRSEGFPAIKVSARRYVVPEEAFNRWLEEQVQTKKGARTDEGSANTGR